MTSETAEVTGARIMWNIEVIDVMNLRSDTKTDVEKLGSTVRTLGIDARMPKDIKGLE
jgi:hypothetical protein